ncbi:MAG: biopolymer transporter ExbD [Prevotellaceae bacterium]|jgi:biopolymer transport protein ExbD|nr:biopolymer transporter ExbD [Prevotellaceae bacterium]
MAKFTGKKGKKLAGFSTASMGDIVFILLFFFMVTTTMRETEVKVRTDVPKASEVTKLERKDLTVYINIGPPIASEQARYGTDACIQLNDSFKTVDDIRNFIASFREGLAEADRPYMTTALKIDKETRMGIVSDVKEELRRCQALKIMYNAIKAE